MNVIEKHNKRYCGSKTIAECNKEKALAVRAGQKLLKMMKGKGWHLHVFENLGWHYAVINGPLYVSNDNSLYSALLSDDIEKAGWAPAYWSPGYRGFKDPNDAVRYVVSFARHWVNNRQKALAFAEDYVFEAGAV